MQTPETPRTTAKRKESLLGICQAIGDDFGFNADILRIALAVSLLADPKITLTVYALMGVVVLTSRLATRPWHLPRIARFPRATARVEERSLVDA